MIPELLVVVGCVYGKGCSETATAYYNYNPQLQIIAFNLERLAPTSLKTYLAPVAFYALNGTPALKLTNVIQLQISKSNKTLIFSKDF
jgi:hypothetical protein